MKSEFQVSGEDIGDRRRVARNDCDSRRQITVLIDPSDCHEGKVINESLGGIGLEFKSQLPLKLSEEMEVTYNGVKMSAIVRHIGTDGVGKCRVGFEWKAVGFSQRAKQMAAASQDLAPSATGDQWEISRFRDAVPRGLYVMLRFFEDEKWIELSETGDRMAILAEGCGMHKIRKLVQDLSDAAQLIEPKEPARKVLHTLIEECIHLAVDTDRPSEAVHPGDSSDDKQANAEESPEDADEPQDGSIGTGKTIGDRKIPDEDAPTTPRSAFETMIYAMARTDNGNVLQSLAQGLKTMAIKLPIDVAEVAFSQIVLVLENTDDYDAVQSLVEALNSIVEKLTPERAFRAVVSVMEKTGNSVAMESLAGVLQDVVQKLPAEAAENVFPLVVSTIQHGADDCMLQAVVDVLKMLAKDSRASNAEKVMSLVILAMKRTENAMTLGSLAHIAETAAKKLPAASAAMAFPHIVSVVEATTDDDVLQSLINALEITSRKLPRDAAEEVFHSTIAMMDAINDFDSLQTLGEILKTTAKKMSDDVAEKVFYQLVDVMESRDDHRALQGLAEGLKTLTARLSVDAVQKVCLKP